MHRAALSFASFIDSIYYYIQVHQWWRRICFNKNELAEPTHTIIECAMVLMQVNEKENKQLCTTAATAHVIMLLLYPLFFVWFNQETEKAFCIRNTGVHNNIELIHSNILLLSNILVCCIKPEANKFWYKYLNEAFFHVHYIQKNCMLR